MKVEFHAIAAGGDAVGHDDSGRVIFASHAAPGDVAEVVVKTEHHSFARGRVINLLSPSPQRVASPCEYYLPDASGDLTTACGGCQLQHLSYAAQLEAKANIVRDALRRIAGIGEPNVAPCVPSPLPFHYRNKADFVVTQDDAGIRIGFCAPNSHHTIDVAHCPIQQPANNALLAAVRDCVQAGLAPPFEPASGRGVLRRIVARTAANGETLVTAVTTRAAWPQAAEFAARLRAAVPSLMGVLRRKPQQAARVISGRDWLEENVAGLRLRVGGDSFFQINTSLTPMLVGTALRLAKIEPRQRSLDLFCGVGLFALAMARQGASVLGIETSRQAVRQAVLNARQNGLKAEFRSGDAARELRNLAADEWDVVVLDPPRAGAKECITELARLRPRRIVYVSCDPATLARDVKLLGAHEYCLREAVPLDLFPQTAHVEVVAKLEKIR